MPVVSSKYWNMVHGNNKEETEQDLEGLLTMRTLGRNMAFLIKSINMGKEKINNKDEKQKASPKHMSIKSILGGDILATDFFKRQTNLLILIMILTIFYINNRYESQQEMIEIDRLRKELTDIKYDALTRSSELMEKSRQSRIEEYISQEESFLETATSRPYLIK